MVIDAWNAKLKGLKFMSNNAADSRRPSTIDTVPISRGARIAMPNVRVVPR
jgi:hypothetical protein